MRSSESSGSRVVDVAGGTVIFLIIALALIGLMTWVMQFTPGFASGFVRALSLLQLAAVTQATLVFGVFTLGPIVVAGVYEYFVAPRLHSAGLRRAGWLLSVAAIVALGITRTDARDSLPPAAVPTYEMLSGWFIKVGLGCMLVWGGYRIVRWLIIDERAARADAVTPKPPL